MGVILRAACLIVLGVTVASCSSPGSTPAAPTAPTQQAAMPTMSGSGPAGLADADAKLMAVTPADSPSGQPPCQYNPGSGEFECPSQTRDGITFTRQFELYDAKGVELSQFGPNVASIKTETSANGTTTRENGAVATIQRAGWMKTTGLGPNATSHTLNGVEHGTVTATWTATDGTKITTTTTIIGTTENLVVPVRTGDRSQAYPLSGTRTHTTTTTGWGGKGPLTVGRQETFNGTSTVQVQMRINGVSQSCTFDLATKTSTCRQNP